MERIRDLDIIFGNSGRGNETVLDLSRDGLNRGTMLGDNLGRTDLGRTDLGRTDLGRTNVVADLGRDDLGRTDRINPTIGGSNMNLISRRTNRNEGTDRNEKKIELDLEIQAPARSSVFRNTIGNIVKSILPLSEVDITSEKNIIHVYRNFSHITTYIKQSGSSSVECLSIDLKTSKIYDLLVYKNDVPVDFHCRMKDLSKVTTKRGTTYEGIVHEFNGEFHVELDNRTIKLLDVVEVEDNFRKECVIKLGRPCEEECNLVVEPCKVPEPIKKKEECVPCDDPCKPKKQQECIYKITYKTDWIIWEPKLVLKVDCDCNATLCLTGCLMPSVFFPFKADVNLVFGHVYPRPNKHHGVLMRSTINNESEASTQKVIKVGESCNITRGSLYHLEHDSVSCFKTYYVENNSSDVEYGYTVKTKFMIPKSTIEVYEDELFVGSNCVKETRQDDYFNVKLGKTADLGYSFFEEKNGKQVLFKYSIWNKTGKEQVVYLKYHHYEPINHVEFTGPHKRYKDFIVFSMEIPAASSELVGTINIITA